MKPGRAPLFVFLGVGGALGVALVAYTVLHRPPRLPADADHRRTQSSAECLECHGPSGKSPRGPNHPPAQSGCFNCHEGT